MTIPEVRARLYELAEALDSAELYRLATELHRRKPIRKKAPTQHLQATAARVQAIREYAALHPEVAEDIIGTIFGVNQGRVSEALAGKRT